MVLVPLGISVNSWSRSIDPKSQNRSAFSSGSVFTDDSGTKTFHRVNSPGSSGNKAISKKMKQTVVSPVSQILAQTKEKEKMTDSPDDGVVSLNVAASSSSSKRKKSKKTSEPRKKITSNSPSKMKAAIKRLQKKRNGQSIKGIRGVKKQASVSKSVNKKKS